MLRGPTRETRCPSSSTTPCLRPRSRSSRPSPVTRGILRVRTDGVRPRARRPRALLRRLATSSIGTFSRRGFASRTSRNVTDVDDKILKRAAETRREPTALAARFTHELPRRHDARSAARRRSSRGQRAHPRDHRAHRAAHRRRGLRVRRAASDVYFDVASDRRLRQALASQPRSARGGRERAHRLRRTSARSIRSDFALWKGAERERVGLGEPVGMGPPGVAHRVLRDVACTTSARRFDLHGGGMDLIFPHHENEIAQSESATGKAVRATSGSTTASSTSTRRR